MNLYNETSLFYISLLIMVMLDLPFKPHFKIEYHKYTCETCHKSSHKIRHT